MLTKQCKMKGTAIELQTAAPTMALTKIIHSETDLRSQGADKRRELPIARSGT
jgi:hypothetical protein